jgi:hypothetical protein
MTGFCARITSAGVTEIVRCAEATVKQKYDSTLQGWTQHCSRKAIEGEVSARRVFGLEKKG